MYLCGRQNNVPLKDLHTLFSGIWKYLMLHGKTDFADKIIKVIDLKEGNYP